MGRKALRKDFYREIRSSLGRFLSIFFIVAIGVAFFSGIRASEPDMRYSGDAYFDQKNLMDIEVISTLGPQMMILRRSRQWKASRRRKADILLMHSVRRERTRSLSM